MKQPVKQFKVRPRTDKFKLVIQPLYGWMKTTWPVVYNGPLVSPWSQAKRPNDVYIIVENGTENPSTIQGCDLNGVVIVNDILLYDEEGSLNSSKKLMRGLNNQKSINRFLSLLKELGYNDMYTSTPSYVKSNLDLIVSSEVGITGIYAPKSDIIRTVRCTEEGVYEIFHDGGWKVIEPGILLSTYVAEDYELLFDYLI